MPADSAVKLIYEVKEAGALCACGKLPDRFVMISRVYHHNHERSSGIHAWCNDCYLKVLRHHEERIEVEVREDEGALHGLHKRMWDFS